jgi:lysozyme family protein
MAPAAATELSIRASFAIEDGVVRPGRKTAGDLVRNEEIAANPDGAKGVAMLTHEQRLNRLRGHVGDAQAELHGLPAEERDAHEADLARLDAVLAHADALLATADPRLLSTAAFTSVQTAAARISNDPRAALDDADACADALVDALSLLPASGAGREARQAREFLRSAARRVRAVREDVDAESGRLTALRSEVESWKSAAEETIAAQADRHRQTFEEHRQAEAAEFRSGMDAFRAEFEERVAEIRRMESETATLVEAIAVAGTWEHYRRQSRRQRIVAEVLRGLAVLATLGAVTAALLTTAWMDTTTDALVASLVAAAVLVGLAAYFARQSARHRAREEETARVQFELAAFSPFVESLPPERREEERVLMTRKLFGTAPPAPADEHGAATGFLWRRKPEAVQPAAAANGSPANGTAPH